MRHGFVLAALLVPLGGCYLPPQPAPAYGYAAPGYQQPEYAPDPYAAPVDPGYGYDAGAPVIMEGGAAVPLVLFGSEWGYYDHERHWRRAPDQYQHQNWGGHPGAPPPHYEGRPPQAYEQHPHDGGRYGGPPPGRPPEAVRPAAAPAQAPRPAPQQHEQHNNSRGCQPNQRC
nr:hypothetical protein [uncultured Rhodopila sp.]